MRFMSNICVLSITCLLWMSASAQNSAAVSRIAVFPFKEELPAKGGITQPDNTKLDGLGVAIAKILSDRLAQPGVIEVDTAAYLLAGVPENEVFSAPAMSRIWDVCAQFGVTDAIIGYYRINNQRIALTIRTFDSRSGRPVHTFRIMSDLAARDLFSVITKMAAWMLDTATAKKARAEEDSSFSSGTSDLQSLLYFGKGFACHQGIGQSVNLRQAESWYRQSLSLDPDFELPARYRSTICAVMQCDSVRRAPVIAFTTRRLIDSPSLNKESAQEQTGPATGDSSRIQSSEIDSMLSSSALEHPGENANKIELHCERIWWPRNIPLPNIPGQTTRRLFHQDGAIEVDVTRKSGVRESAMTAYYQKSGQIMGTAGFHRNKPDGTCKLYYDDGSVWAEATYSEGKKQGVSKVYYPNGNLQLSVPYVDGKRNGLSCLYYENGQVERAINYTRNALNGITTMYFPNGVIHAEVSYRNNAPDGLCKLYAPDGCLIALVNYRNGRKQGPVVRWNQERIAQAPESDSSQAQKP
jgi:antitoxin component YwqK of YwqJK toxin-antitoxin module